ncbi:MAG: NAD(P)-binding domain-containing protein [Candidatus Sulfotelmatobacter sp.]
MGQVRTKARRTKETAPRTQTKATVFLGGGRITGALIAGLRLAGYDDCIVVYDRNPEKLRELRREFHVEVARDLQSAVARAGVLIVAVRPPSVAELLDEITRSGAIKQTIVAISLAAGIPIKKLRARLGRSVHWARAMPSPVCRIGRGLTAVTFDHQVPKDGRDRIRELFARVGIVLEIPESRFDAFNAAYSPSHGYHALATLARAAQDAGLDRNTALTAAAHAFGDALLYWKQSGLSVADLLQESATPGGTSAATMEAMKKSGYEKAVAAGLKAAIQRARRNARF